MTEHEALAFQLGKQAALRRMTAKSQSVKVNAPGGAAAAVAATKKTPQDARQLPWRYGERGNRMSPKSAPAEAPAQPAADSPSPAGPA